MDDVGAEVVGVLAQPLFYDVQRSIQLTRLSEQIGQSGEQEAPRMRRELLLQALDLDSEAGIAHGMSDRLWREGLSPRGWNAAKIPARFRTCQRAADAPGVAAVADLR